MTETPLPTGTEGHAADAPFHILLVEDDAADAGLVRRALRRGAHPYQVGHVRDGAEAMDYLTRRGDRFLDAPRPDLVLLDLNMPRVDGRETLRRIRANPELHGLPVVVLTTSEVERDIEDSYRLGANSYVTKPMDVHAFFAAVARIGDTWFAAKHHGRGAEETMPSGGGHRDE
ncbi:MAG: hypothetical protein RLY86_534 [Pseudomonadota bacterium]|jgi:CheY-like chemotaxis protein